MQIKDLKQDKRNYRRHNQRNLDLIKKSVTEVGLGRSVVIDNENEIVCGNGLVSTLDKDTPIKVIETDGSELVVVKRTDLATNDDKRKQLALRGSYGHRILQSRKRKNRKTKQGITTRVNAIP